MPVQMIATDLDGTFFSENYGIHPENLLAVKAAQKAGILVCACSARLWGYGGQMVEMGGFDRLAVFNNGAAVADAKTGEAIFKLGIAPKHFRELIEAANSFGCAVQSWNHDFIGIYGPSMGERAILTKQRNMDPNAKVRCEVRIYDTIDEMDRDCRDVAQKLLLSLDPKYISDVTKKLGEICEVEVSTSNPSVVEVTMPGATKGKGVEKLAEFYGIPHENILAIGDNDNDICMLDVAGIKVCVGNGTENIKRVAQHIVGKNTEGGFAQAVYQYALR
jgi:Cof subfamily protein (haloacid dehalogenase superfamily)